VKRRHALRAERAGCEVSEEPSYLICGLSPPGGGEFWTVVRWPGCSTSLGGPDSSGFRSSSMAARAASMPDFNSLKVFPGFAFPTGSAEALVYTASLGGRTIGAAESYAIKEASGRSGSENMGRASVTGFFETFCGDPGFFFSSALLAPARAAGVGLAVGFCGSPPAPPVDDVADAPPLVVAL
jgi:hypothetical protein